MFERLGEVRNNISFRYDSKDFNIRLFLLVRNTQQMKMTMKIFPPSSGGFQIRKILFLPHQQMKQSWKKWTGCF